MAAMLGCFAEALYDALHTIPVFSTAVRPAECRRQHDLDFKAWPMLVPISSASKSRGVAASRRPMRWRGPGEAVKVAVRPENVQLGGSGEANRLLARITGQRYQGTQTIYELAVLVCRLLSVWPNNDSTAPAGDCRT